ncbi:hypothetical protein BCR34DRAFT_586390 [Clohesyomyces aquaticus]|uniref:Uncharacterized protein n=1 Tax=Clohesyomyces aquaticus TaxID=1231657 RepID=A0A1Y1ZTN4_9PLEO|nr:hypothetical protein BCR34DRAFT_586390 [Clohesyomyces aquaticus]
MGILSTRDWRPIILNSLAVKVAELDKSLVTPSLEVFALLLTEREALDPGPLPKNVLFALICGAAKAGWTEVTKHLLALQAPLEDPIRFQGDPICGDRAASQLEKPADPPLLHTCRGGFHEIAELLLNSGAKIQGREICTLSKGFSSSAGKGYLGIVRMLLDAGMDPNQGYPLPVVLTIELEHHEMYSLLVERGANIRAPEVWSEAMKVIEKDGLLSMANLLQSGITTVERIAGDTGGIECLPWIQYPI